MHGIFFKGLKDFVTDEYGHDCWQDVVGTIGSGPQIYLPINSYADDEFTSLVTAACDRVDRPKSSFLESFGRALPPHLFGAYGHVVDPAWTTLDVVEHAEAGIHDVLRTHNEKLDPPRLGCQRLDSKRVAVRYRSDRQLCSVAKGIVHGIADHFDETVSVVERKCLLDGDDACVLVVSQ